eukprot:3297848-Amphidinium_carterae.1
MHGNKLPILPLLVLGQDAAHQFGNLAQLLSIAGAEQSDEAAVFYHYTDAAEMRRCRVRDAEIRGL